MIYLNEWLPNPNGTDSKGEFVELYNSGDAAVSLNGYVLKTESGKKFSLIKRTIAAHGYLLLKRNDTKLALRNTEGELFLYSPNGALIDGAHFLGSALSGKSFSRIDHGTSSAQHFAFVDPTPGVVNHTISNAITSQHYPYNTPLNKQLNGVDFLAVLTGTAMLLLGLVMYTIKTNEDLSEFFFGRNKETRGTNREADFT